MQLSEVCTNYHLSSVGALMGGQVGQGVCGGWDRKYIAVRDDVKISEAISSVV